METIPVLAHPRMGVPVKPGFLPFNKLYKAAKKAYNIFRIHPETAFAENAPQHKPAAAASKSSAELIYIAAVIFADLRRFFRKQIF